MLLNNEVNYATLVIRQYFFIFIFSVSGSAIADDGSIDDLSRYVELPIMPESDSDQFEPPENHTVLATDDEGNYQIKLGGWSEHYISGNASNYNFNENHDGIGIAFSNYEEGAYDGRYFNGYNYEVWYMKDSFYEDNLQISYGLFNRRLIDNWGITRLDLGLNFAAISRSIADIDSRTAELNDHKRIHTLMIIPSLSIYTDYLVHFDFVFLPVIPSVTDYSVLFFRVGFDL